MLLSSLISFFTVKIIMNTEAVLLKKQNKQTKNFPYLYFDLFAKYFTWFWNKMKKNFRAV